MHRGAHCHLAAVAARVIKLDQETHKLSLSLKGLDEANAQELQGGASNAEDSEDEGEDPAVGEDMLLALDDEDNAEDNEDDEDEEDDAEDEDDDEDDEEEQGSEDEAGSLEGSDEEDEAGLDDCVGDDEAAPEMEEVGWDEEEGDEEGLVAQDVDTAGTCRLIHAHAYRHCLALPIARD